jgi:uncharacterized protein
LFFYTADFRMFISVQDLEAEPVEFAEDMKPGTIDFGTETKQAGVLHVDGRAELIEEDHGGKNRVQDIRVVGDFSGKFEAACSRCLDPVITEVKSDFDLLYRPLKPGKQGEEISISEAETEIGFYQGDGLDTADVVKEQVLLSLPVKMLCAEDCKGLCSHCGQNLNNGKCGCTEEKSDERWSALQGLRDQLKKN